LKTTNYNFISTY